MSDTKIVSGLRIEDSTVKIINQNIYLDIKHSVFQCFWEFEIQTIYNQEIVLKTRCRMDANHKCISKVCSIEAEEISPFFVKYMLNEACKHVGMKISDKFYNYDFSQLAEYLMESGGYILPMKEDAEQSVMKT